MEIVKRELITNFYYKVFSPGDKVRFNHNANRQIYPHSFVNPPTFIVKKYIPPTFMSDDDGNLRDDSVVFVEGQDFGIPGVALTDVKP